jgi:pilus assembly protein CpaC
MRLLPLSGIAGSVIFVALAVSLGAAEAQAPAPPPRGTVTPAPPPADAQPPAQPRAARGTGAAQIPANGGRIVLEVNKGTLVRLAGPAATVFVANPDIADVQVKSPTLVYISAKAPGETVIYAVDAADNVLLNAPILVEHDVSRLRSSLRQLAPGEQISAESVDGNLVLSGVVADAGKADKVRALAASIAGEVKGSQVINRMTVATPNQVNLQVRIAEVNVTKLNEIGVNWHKVGSTIKFMTNNPVTVAAELQNTLIAGTFSTAADAMCAATGTGCLGATSATLAALEQEGFITNLAQPNLTAMSGQTASFLAGGEFPVPIAGTASSTGFPTITVEFKSFGVSLAFTPTVIDAQHLNLRVRPEVSQLTTIGEVSIPLTSTATVTIPALTVRRAETSVELASGESFALAGLLQHNSEQDVSKVPWIGDIPIIGALFRSDRFQRRETDLVVIVTPYLVQPVQTRMAAPTDGLLLPNDAQRVFLSDKYHTELPGRARGPLNAGGKGLIGPGGFRLD